MTIKEMHDYAYYKMYKSMTLTTDWGASWRAGGVLLMLESLVPWSLLIYHRLIFPYSSPIGLGWIFVPAAILYIIDWKSFMVNDRWKEIVERYEAWPRKKNFRGTLIVWGVILLVVVNMGIAVSLHDQVYWTPYR